jgi:hypothetical protein
MQKTKRSGPIGMLERGRHPICKHSWVDRVWKFVPASGNTKASLEPQVGLIQGTKRAGSSGSGGETAASHKVRRVGNEPPDDGHWKEINEQAPVTFAQDGEWDLDELADLFDG